MKRCKQGFPSSKPPAMDSQALSNQEMMKDN